MKTKDTIWCPNCENTILINNYCSKCSSSKDARISYKIIKALDLDILQKEIEAHLMMGYKLINTINYLNNFYIQQMAKDK